MVAVLEDPRWEALASGTATPEEVADLRAWAKQNQDAAEAWEACQPATEQEIDQLTNELLRKVRASKSTTERESPRPVFQASRDSDMITVYLIDDHPVLREGFARAVNAESGMFVVGQASTAAEALREIPVLKPDVALLDLNIPDRDGAELIAVLRAQVPSPKLLVLSGYDDEFRVSEALRAGAQGYLVKTSSLVEVIDGVRRVARGEAPLSQRIAGAVVRAMRRPTPAGSGGIDALTPRERQVLRLLATGISTRETASRLTISPKTVETHRVRIYAKLGCKNAVELTRIAVRTGLLDDAK